RTPVGHDALTESTCQERVLANGSCGNTGVSVQTFTHEVIGLIGGIQKRLGTQLHDVVQALAEAILELKDALEFLDLRSLVSQALDTTIGERRGTLKGVGGILQNLAG